MFRTDSKTRHRLPPGPKGGLLFGHLRDFRQNPLQFLTRLARDYGDVVSFRIGSQTFVQLSHPDLIKDVLVTHHRNFTKTGYLHRARPILGNGLVTSDGEFHRRQRRLMQPALNRQRVSTYAEVMTERAAGMRDGWREGETVDIFEEMLRLSLQIVARTLFSADVESEADDIDQALTTVLEHFNRLLTHPQAALLAKLPLARNRSFREAQQFLDSFVYRMISERRRHSDDRGDVLSMLLLAQDDEGDGEGMSDEQVRDEVMTLFTAGHETIATALTWSWYCLAQNPQAETAVHEEVDAVLREQLPTADDVSRLKQTEMAMAEAMRIYPPIWGFTRKAIDDYDVGSWVVPAGSIIGLSQYVVHRDPRFFQDPEKFDLSRWTPEKKSQRPRYSYFPFGGGPRLCIGEPFAWLEGVLIIATLAQRWRMRLPPDHDLQFQPLITLRPKGGLPVVLERRKVSSQSETRVEAELSL